nr:M48 family peptidase [Herpetosiphonaceae bacterium]
MPTSDAKAITIDGVTLAVEVTRKQVKNVNARLDRRMSTLVISAPLSMSPATLEPIIADLGRKLLRRVRANEVNAEEAAHQLAQRVAARFSDPPRVAQVLFVTTQQA